MRTQMKPVEDVNIELYTGNKILKHSLLTNERRILY